MSQLLKVSVFLSLALITIICDQKLNEEDLKINYFPDYFLFGSASSAYQVEGGWNEDGKGPSIWDELTQKHPELITDHSNGNVGPYSYKYYKNDVDALKELGVK